MSRSLSDDEDFALEPNEPQEHGTLRPSQVHEKCEEQAEEFEEGYEDEEDDGEYNEEGQQGVLGIGEAAVEDDAAYEGEDEEEEPWPSEFDSDQLLGIGESLLSENRAFEFTLQMTGEMVVLRTVNGSTSWTSNTAHLDVSHCCLDDNGELCLFNQQEVVWRCGVPGATRVAICEDGCLVTANDEGDILWETGADDGYSVRTCEAQNLTLTGSVGVLTPPSPSVQQTTAFGLPPGPRSLDDNDNSLTPRSAARLGVVPNPTGLSDSLRTSITDSRRSSTGSAASSRSTSRSSSRTMLKRPISARIPPSDINSVAVCRLRCRDACEAAADGIADTARAAATVQGVQAARSIKPRPASPRTVLRNYRGKYRGAATEEADDKLDETSRAEALRRRVLIAEYLQSVADDVVDSVVALVRLPNAPRVIADGPARVANASNGHAATLLHVLCALHPSFGLLRVVHEEPSARTLVLAAELAEVRSIVTDAITSEENASRETIAALESSMRDVREDDIRDRLTHLLERHYRQQQRAALAAECARMREEEAKRAEAARKAAFDAEVLAMFEADEAKKREAMPPPEKALPSFDSACERIRRSVFHSVEGRKAAVAGGGGRLTASQADFAMAAPLTFANKAERDRSFTLLDFDVPTLHGMPPVHVAAVGVLPDGDASGAVLNQGDAIPVSLRTDIGSALVHCGSRGRFDNLCRDRRYRVTIRDLGDALSALYDALSNAKLRNEHDARDVDAEEADEISCAGAANDDARPSRPTSAIAAMRALNPQAKRPVNSRTFISADASQDGEADRAARRRSFDRIRRLHSVVEAAAVAWAARFSSIDIEDDDPHEALAAAFDRFNTRGALEAAKIDAETAIAAVLTVTIVLHDVCEALPTSPAFRSATRFPRALLLCSDSASRRGVLPTAELAAAITARKADLGASIGPKALRPVRDAHKRVCWLAEHLTVRWSAAHIAGRGRPSAAALKAAGATAAQRAAGLPHLNPISFYSDLIGAIEEACGTHESDRPDNGLRAFFALFPKGITDVMCCLIDDVVWHPSIAADRLGREFADPASGAAPKPPAPDTPPTSGRPTSAKLQAQIDALNAPPTKPGGAIAALRPAPPPPPLSESQVASAKPFTVNRSLRGLYDGLLAVAVGLDAKRRVGSHSSMDPVADASHRFALIASLREAAETSGGSARRSRGTTLREATGEAPSHGHDPRLQLLLPAAESLFGVIEDVTAMSCVQGPAIERAARFIVTVLELPVPPAPEGDDDLLCGGRGTFFSALQDYVVAQGSAGLWSQLARPQLAELALLGGRLVRPGCGKSTHTDNPLDLDGWLDAVTCDNTCAPLGALLRYATALDSCARAAAPAMPFASIA